MPRYVNCNMCKGDNTSLLFIKDSLRIVKCVECGLIYVNPRLSKEDLKKNMYEKDYFNGSQGTNFFSERKLYLHRFQERLRQISTFKKEGKLLDIGCAVGYFLEVAKKEGWQVFGVEISSFASKYTKESGFNVFTGTVEEAKYPSMYFDVVTLWHTFEHMEDPLGSLKEIHRILRENGLIAIEVPNIGSRRFKKQRENWDYLKPKEHLYYFTQEVLEKMIRKAGFKVLEITAIPDRTCIGKELVRLGRNKLKEQLIKHFNYLSWIRKSILWLKKIVGTDDVILLYALKK